jgi:diguanylate cyclase (GGDEF)-like protein
MSEAVLADMIEAWLARSGRRFAMRFPKPLEEHFERDTSHDRCRTMSNATAVGFALGVVLYLIITATLRDVSTLGSTLFLGVAVPLGFFVAATLRLHPPPKLREWLTTLANLVCVAVTAILFTFSQIDELPYFFATMTIMLIYSIIGVQLRFGYAVFACIVTIATYAAGVAYSPGIPVATGRNLLVLATLVGAYLLLANWRLERESRRNYLVGLRDRLQRQALSTRNRELDELASRDPLTALANRRAYDTWLHAYWHQARLLGSRVGLVIIDVDRFKDYNDFYGHAAGDLCLQALARCLRDQLRGTTDLVARLGGEEFAILLPGLPPELCADIAERIRVAVQAMELPHLGQGAGGLVTISAGVASLPAEPGNTPAALFAAADAALYAAKHQGRNQVCVGATMPQAATAPVVTS